MSVGFGVRGSSVKLYSLVAAFSLFPASVAASVGASPFRVTVDKKGAIRIPAAVLRKFRIKEAENGMIAIQFPVSVLDKPRNPPGAEHHPTMAPVPPSVWMTLRADGSLYLPRTKLVPGREFVPGAPGKVYLATGEKGRLVLKDPAGRH